MTAARIVGGPEVVLAAHGHVGWLTVPAECPTCRGEPWIRSDVRQCPVCGGSGRNPIINLAGHTVEMWTSTTPPEMKRDWTGIDEGPQYGPYWKVFRTDGGPIELCHSHEGVPGAPWPIPVPLGVCVGTAHIARVDPIVSGNYSEGWPEDTPVCVVVDVDGYTNEPIGLRFYDRPSATRAIDISDQLPFSLWEPGRWAIHLTEPKART